MVNKKYIMEIADLMDLLHELKHLGHLPECLSEYHDLIERFDPAKLL